MPCTAPPASSPNGFQRVFHAAESQVSGAKGLSFGTGRTWSGAPPSSMSDTSESSGVFSLCQSYGPWELHFQAAGVVLLRLRRHGLVVRLLRHPVPVQPFADGNTASGKTYPSLTGRGSSLCRRDRCGDPRDGLHTFGLRAMCHVAGEMRQLFGRGRRKLPVCLVKTCPTLLKQPACPA